MDPGKQTRERERHVLLERQRWLLGEKKKILVSVSAAAAAAWFSGAAAAAAAVAAARSAPHCMAFMIMVDGRRGGGGGGGGKGEVGAMMAPSIHMRRKENEGAGEGLVANAPILVFPQNDKPNSCSKQQICILASKKFTHYVFPDIFRVASYLFPDGCDFLPAAAVAAGVELSLLRLMAAAAWEMGWR